LDYYPVTWSNNYFENLFGFEWELTKSPAGAHNSNQLAMLVLEPFLMHDPTKTHQPSQLVTDLSLRIDPAYEKISRHF
jgi:catalase-peroxidase